MSELTKPLDPLQEAYVTKMIDDRLKNICAEIENQAKSLDTMTSNPYTSSTRLAMRMIASAIKDDLLS